MLKAAILGLLAATTAFAATPPPLVNYQGVLRDQNDNPLTGSYDMLFRFMDAASGGNEILTDQHALVTGNPVTVTNGLFNLALGSGTVADGSGPGSYTSLDAVFRDYGNVWLEIKVGAETLTPRTKFQSAAYALNATNAVAATTASTFNGYSTSFFLDTSSTYQTKSGGVLFQNYDPSIPAIEAYCANNTPTGITSINCTDTGGYFAANGSSTTGVVASGGAYGVRGYGNVAGLFIGPNSYEYAYLGDAPDQAGFAVNGRLRGGFFSSSQENYGDLGFFDGFRYYGVWAHGFYTGGYFEENYSGTFGFVADAVGSTIHGNGSKDFVQSDPELDDRTITYASLEGDEVGTYTRGTARLVGGEAKVALGSTFRLVTDPELGLTAYVAPIGAPARLYVAEKTTSEIVVKAAPGDPDVDFDYIVVGLRIGFENFAVVREKDAPAPIPKMRLLDEQMTRHPELRASTPRSRFETMEKSAGREVRASYPEADALIAKIKASDHGVTESPASKLARLPGFEERVKRQAEAGAVAVAQPAAMVGPEKGLPGAPVLETPAPTPAPVVAATREFEASEPVDAGDLLALDPSAPGKLHRAMQASDSTVVGVAVESSKMTESGLTVSVAAAIFASVKADAETGPILAGDLLVASPIPGYATAAQKPSPGTVVGKALDNLDAGTGMIRVLLMAR